jgi:hypothetical protein
VRAYTFFCDEADACLYWVRTVLNAGKMKSRERYTEGGK